MNILNQFTCRTLAKNKIRTLVTIIGIALSVAMFTAVTSIIVSVQQYILNTEMETNGAWEGKVLSTTEENAKSIIKDKKIKGYTVIDYLGYAKLEKTTEDGKPYLTVEGIDSNYTKYSPITILEGRMPKNAQELVIPKHLDYNGGIKYQVGDTISLKLGTRMTKVKNKEEALTEQNPYQEKEYLKINRTQTYTIVGICERPASEEDFASGYTAFTCSDGKSISGCDVFMTFQHPETCDSALEKYTKNGGAYTTHGDLLRYQGNSLNDRYNRTIYTLGFILIMIIMLGAISLIYNAFSISLSERTKQYGLLKSIGATKKQILYSVLLEGGLLCCIGIPLGLLAGLGGIGITLHGISGFMNQLWASQVSVRLHLVITWQSVVISSVIGIVTVFLSSMIPAVRAVRIPAIQAIRQSRDIKIRANKIKTSRITYRIFGFCGMLASKNFKRNRKKYRTTVFSLFISIVLFVSATSFTGYITRSTNAVSQNVNYDIICAVQKSEAGDMTVSQLTKAIGSLSAVDSVSYFCKDYSEVEVPQEAVDDTFLQYIQENYPEWIPSGKKSILLPIDLYFVEDSVYRSYLEKQNLDVSQYMHADDLSCLYENEAAILKDKKLYTMKYFKKGGFDLSLQLARSVKGYKYMYREGDSCYYQNETGKEKKLPLKKAMHTYPVHLAKELPENRPMGVSVSSMDMIMTMVLPYSAAERNGMLEDLDGYDQVWYALKAKQHEKASTQLADYFSARLVNEKYARSSIVDERRNNESSMALVTIIQIFSYGFIILISLISVANVFNTISSNVLLRRQEFAMLKSVGMTQRGFQRMMSYECILYGLKSLLWGIPVSLLLSYFMYRAVGIGMDTPYLFPWQGILTSAVNVFLVVFISMLYAMRKMKRDNPLEALRNENL